MQAGRASQRLGLLPMGFREDVEQKEKRAIRGRKGKKRSMWYGFGLFGIVGWLVMIPTVLGIGIGVYLDRTLESRFSWTLMCSVLGIAIGCLNAWFWVSRERKQIEKERYG